MEFLDNAITFAKDKIDFVMDKWDSLSEEKKKLFIGCAVVAVSVIVVCAIAYSIGKSHGRRSVFEEDF